MPTFCTAEQAIIKTCQEAMRRWHPDLVKYGVTVAVLEAHAARDKEGQPKGPALKLHGEQCWAVVQINSQKDRAEGKTDATITVDGDRWEELSDESALAVMDHELYHLAVCPDDENEGAILLDDCNRPKLKMRMHDFVIGGFSQIIDRHGVNAVEAKQYIDLNKVMTQKTFAWG